MADGVCRYYLESDTAIAVLKEIGDKRSEEFILLREWICCIRNHDHLPILMSV